MLIRIQKKGHFTFQNSRQKILTSNRILQVFGMIKVPKTVFLDIQKGGEKGGHTSIIRNTLPRRKWSPVDLPWMDWTQRVQRILPMPRLHMQLRLRWRTWWLVDGWGTCEDGVDVPRTRSSFEGKALIFFRGWKDESKKSFQTVSVKVAKRIWNVTTPATLGWFSLYPFCGVIFAMCSTQLTNWWLTFRSFNLDCFIAVLIHGGSITGVVVSNIFSLFTWRNDPIGLCFAYVSKSGLGRKNTNLGSLYFHYISIFPKKSRRQKTLVNLFLKQTANKRCGGIPCSLRFMDECFLG